MTTTIGVVGLGVMGRNLVLNCVDKGIRVVAHDPWDEAQKRFAENLPDAIGDQVTLAEDADQLVALLPQPRIILIMVKAGAPVDDVIDSLRPYLQGGDILIDGGNTHYRDTTRRGISLKKQGLFLIGLGVSGGAKGAREGPSLMAGGEAEAYDGCRNVLEAIAARFGDDPCCALLGPGGAGHFVKMIHNGIEYGMMQAIAESYVLLRDLCGQDHAAMAETFRLWNRSKLRSYLVEITADILAKADDLAEGPLVEAISDVAEQKGTGRWSSEAALAYGVPAPTIAEAVFARALASQRQQRLIVSNVVDSQATTDSSRTDEDEAESIRQALLCTMIACYAQGLAIIGAAGQSCHWALDMATVVRIWRAGCIVRADLLGDVATVFADGAHPYVLLGDADIAGHLMANERGWRRTVADSVACGIPIPAMSSALAYFDGYRSKRLGANLIQAQRDYFGAHGYERADRPGQFHTRW